MGRRSLIVATTVGLFLLLMLATSSQADQTLITVNSTLSSIPNGVTGITELDVTFTGIPPLNNLTLLTPKPSTGATIMSVGSEIEISIPPSVSMSYIDVFDQAFATFSFTIPGDGSDIQATTTTWVTNSGNISGSSSVFLTAIPEPASIVLLGVGVAGCIALRTRSKWRGSR